MISTLPRLRTLIACSLVAACAVAQANNLLDMAKQQLGGSSAAPAAPSGGGLAGGAGALAGAMGLSMPGIGSSTAGNAAGVLQYCVKNKFLRATDASAVKDKLMGMVTGQKPQQEGYASGAKGTLMGADGKSLNLQGLSSKIKDKACDYVLDNAGKLI